MSMGPKSAVPTPIMTIDKGKSDPATISSIVYCMSMITPSVRIIRIVYY